MDDEQPSGTSREDESLARFTAQALRPPKQRGVYERIVAQRLVLSTSATPLKAVQLVTRAALMVPQEDLEELEIDRSLVDVLNTVANSLLNVSKTHTRDDFRTHVICKIGWPFTENEENFDKYIKPWRKGMLKHYPSMLRKKHDFSSYNGEYFFDATNWALCLSGYNQLVSSFTRWAQPKVEEMTRKLSSLIDPETYDSMLETLSRGEEPGEE